MTDNVLDPVEIQASLDKMTALIDEIAQNCQGNTQELLYLLRTIESSHRRIRTELFEVSLPDNRQALYHLLREIEDEGGWPYIEKMRIKDFLKHIYPEIAQDSTQDRET